MKKTDKQIIKVIKKHKALTNSELIEKLGYSRNGLNARLKRLIMQDKIKFRMLTGISTSARTSLHRLFYGYTDRNIYYIDEEDFIEWVKKHLPENLSRPVRRTITYKLHNIGLDIDLTPKYVFKPVSIHEELHAKLKAVAEATNRTIRDVAEDALKQYLEAYRW